MLARLRALALRLLGSRRLSPLSAEMQALAFDAGIRTRANWLVPGLAVFGLALVLVALHSITGAMEGFTRIFLRIFVIDIGFFVMAWVSGWNSARTWGANRGLTEEASLTPITPHRLVHAIMSGSLAPWTVTMPAFMVVDMLALLFASPDGGGGLRLLHFASMSIFFALLGVSQLESVRLSHVIFARAAMPGVPLRRIAKIAFEKIVLAVLGLSFAGCAVTGGIALSTLAAYSGGATPAMREELTWSFASLAGLCVVIVLKRSEVRREIRGFAQMLLLCQWHGIGETVQPEYSPEMKMLANVHEAHLELEEMHESPQCAAVELQKMEKRYLNILAFYERARSTRSWDVKMPPKLNR